MQAANRQRQSAFTLIEVLIAVAVFSIMAVMAYSGLNNALNISAATQQRADRLHRLQMTMAFIERDLSQAMRTRIRDELGDYQPPLVATPGRRRRLEFSRAGWRNPTGRIRATLQRVAYRVEENTLYREFWTFMNRAPNAEPQQTTLLEGIDEITFELMGQRREFHTTWPPANISGFTMPIAARVTLTLEKDDDNTSREEFVRLIEIPSL